MSLPSGTKNRSRWSSGEPVEKFDHPFPMANAFAALLDRCELKDLSVFLSMTDEEFDAIKLHPEIGHRILKDLTGLEDVLPGVLHHHERIDGNGYPHGLKGDEIPRIARILACADTFDAMSSNRACRDAMPREKVLAELDRCKGTQFDPDVVDAFLLINLQTYDAMVAEAKAQRKAVAA